MSVASTGSTRDMSPSVAMPYLANQLLAKQEKAAAELHKN
jgi:hypothetical protein